MGTAGYENSSWLKEEGEKKRKEQSDSTLLSLLREEKEKAILISLSYGGGEE